MTSLHPFLHSIAADTPNYGYWLEPKTQVRVRLYACDDDKQLLCGRIVGVPANKPKTDIHNPLDNLRHRPLRGLEILQEFAPVDKQTWEGGGKYGELPGRIYLPANGDTLGDHKNRYRVTIEGDVLSISVANCGFINCFTKSEWERLDEEALVRATQKADASP